MSTNPCVRKIMDETGAEENQVLQALQKAEAELKWAKQNNYRVDLTQLSQDNAAALMQQEKRILMDKIRSIDNKIKLESSTKEVFDNFKKHGGKINDWVEKHAQNIKDAITSKTEKYASKFYSKLVEADVLDYVKLRQQPELVAKYIGKLTAKGADGQPLIRSGGIPLKLIPESEQMAYKTAHAWEEMVDAGRKEMDNLGVPVGFLENRIAKSSFNPNKIAPNAAAKQEFVKDMVEVFGDWDKTFTGTHTPEEFASRLWDKINAGIRGKQKGIDDIFGNVFDDIIGETSFAGTSLAKRLGKNRTIQFKPEMFHAFMEKYGNGDIYDYMQSTMEQLSRDTTLISTFGGNPYKQWDDMLGILKNETIDLGKAGKHPLDAKETSGLINELTGKAAVPDDYLTARIFSSSKKMLNATLLHNSFFRSLTDPVIQGMHAARIRGTEGFFNQVGVFLEEFRRNLEIRSAGLDQETLKAYFKGEAEALNFFRSEMDSNFGLRELTSGKTNRGKTLMDKALDVSDSVSDKVFFHLNPVAKWTDAGFQSRRAGFAYMLGDLSDKSYKQLSKGTQRYLDEIGLGKYWESLRGRFQTDAAGKKFIMPHFIEDISQAEVEKIIGRDITPREFENFKQQIFSDVGGAFHTDASSSLAMPGIGYQSYVSSRFARGDLGGELGRSFFHLKSYPISFLSNMVAPLLRDGQFGVLTAGTGLALATQLIADDIIDFISGKTPKPYNFDSEEGRYNSVSLATKVIGLPWVEEILLSGASGEGLKASDLAKFAGPVVTSTWKTLGQGYDIAAGTFSDDKEKAMTALAKTIYEAPIIGPLTHGHILGSAINNVFTATVLEMAKPGTMSARSKFAEKTGQRYYSLTGQFPDFVEDTSQNLFPFRSTQ